MKTPTITILTFLVCNFFYAQGNDLAIQSYKEAEEAFNKGNFTTTLSNLDITEIMLKSTNPKIQGLKLKTYQQLALADSTTNFKMYADYVTDLKTKKSSIANEASIALKNFSKEKVLFLENKRNSLINPIEEITIGQKFSDIQKQKYSQIDFENPKDEKSVWRYNRKSNLTELQTGLFEILVNKNNDQIIKITTILKLLSVEELGKINIGNFYAEKLGKFDPKRTTTSNEIEKFNKKEYNIANSQSNIDDKTLYFLNFYTPTKVNYKDIKNNHQLYFFTEGYEIKP